jgi:hypothetical protein
MKQNYFLNLIASVLLVLVLSSSAVAQYSFTALNTAVTENFNGLGESGGAQGTTGTLTANEEFAVTVLPNWRVWRRITAPGGSATIPLFGGADVGSTASGSVYNYGNDADRAIGSLASGTTQPTFGTSYVNNISGQTITSVSISYRGEQWRSGGRSNAAPNPVNEILVFQYRITGTDLQSGVWTPFPALDFNELNPTAGDAMGGGASFPLNGNGSGNNVAISATLTGLTILNGQRLWIRWDDSDNTGTDNGFGVDDLVVTPTATTSNESDIAASGVAGVSVYANPTSGRFNVDFSLSRAEKVSLSLVDLTGATRQVLQAEQALEAGSYSRTVDTEVAPGLYFVAVETSRGRKLTKLVVSE